MLIHAIKLTTVKINAHALNEDTKHSDENCGQSCYKYASDHAVSHILYFQLDLPVIKTHLHIILLFQQIIKHL